MTFFYDLNKRLNGIRELPETTHKQLNESKPDFLDLDKDGDKKEPMKQAAKQKPDYKSKMQDKFGGSASDLTKGLTTKSKKVNEVKQIEELSTGTYNSYMKTSKDHVDGHKQGSDTRYSYRKSAGPMQDRELNTKKAQKFAAKKLGVNEESNRSIRDVLAYEIEMILDGAAAGDDQTDHIVDELGDIFNDIKASRDKVAMMAYEMMVDTIDEDATTQAVAARKALALLKNNSANMAEGNYSKDAMELNPDFAKVGKKPGVMGKIAQGVKKVADFVAPGDEDLMRDFERETGGRRPTKEAAALAELSPATIQSAAAKRDAQQPDQMSKATQRKDITTHLTNRIKMNARPTKVAEETGLNKSVEAASKIINKTDPYSTHVGSLGSNHVFFSGSSGSDEHIYHIFNDKTKDTDTVSFYHEGNPQSLKDIAAAVYDYSIAKIIHGHHTDNLDESVKPMSAKQKSFAKLAPPEDEITFADKIAGAKKEVDEMLGDVAAEAMKSALGKKQVRGMGEATKEIPGGRRHTAGPGGYGRKDDEDAPRVQTQRGRGRPKKNADSETGQVMKPDWSAFGVGKVNLPKHKGAVTKHKMVGESPDQQQVQQIYNELAEIRAAAKQAQRGGQFPQGFASQLESVLWSAMTLIQNQQPGNAQVREGADPKTWTTIEDVEFIEDLMDRAFEAGSNSLGNTLQGVLEVIKYNQDDEEPVNEKAVSKKQQRFMGMVHAAKKGEKPASKEVARAAKGISAKEADKFASTKHKGLPEKAKEDTDTRDTRAEKAGRKVTKDIEYDEKAKDGDHGKKRGPQDAKAEKAGKKVAKDIEHDEKVDETTVSGSVATAPAAGGKKAKGGFAFGQGVYEAKIAESYESRLSAVLKESMSINTSMNNDADNGQGKSLTITATDEDAEALSDILKMAGLFSSGGYTQVSRDGSNGCSECGGHDGMHEASCGHRGMVEEELANSANNTGYADTDIMVNKLSGGLNGPKLQVNPNNPGDNPLAMGDLGRSAHSLNLGRVAENVELEAQKSLWNLYKGIK